jgi:hypothetical protein
VYVKTCISYNQILLLIVNYPMDGYMIRDRLASSEHREHTWKISMNRYGYVRKEMDTYIVWGKGIHGENVFPGGDVQSLMILYELMKVVSKKLHVSILLLYKNVCINFVTYKFCYRINNVCINFVTV